MLYRTYIESPDVANMIGIYPKPIAVMDTATLVFFIIILVSYEMYRDFQETSVNSDGSFAMWIFYIATIYSIHTFYSYLDPWYWGKTASLKNGE